MRSFWKAFSYALAVAFFASYYWGYSNEAEILLFMVAIVASPIYVAKRLRKGEENAAPSKAQEAGELSVLKNKMSITVIALEIFFGLALVYKLTSVELFAYLAGAFFVIIAYLIFRLWNATCPKCGKHFFRVKEPTPTVTVSPGGFGIHHYPIQVEITHKCMQCGVSWHA